MEKNFYVNDLRQIFKAKVIPPSPLIRKDGNLFTFSPIQDELEFFQESEQGIYYKEQVCFRNAYPRNPISTPCQTLISLFSFHKTNYGHIIDSFITKFLSKWIQFDDIYIICPKISDVLGQMYNVTNRVIEIDESRLRCDVPLSGNHYYIKICVKFHSGLVTLMNFVLIDFHEGFQSQLDSVFFPLRLDMVRENAKSIYECRKYLPIYNKLYTITQNHELTHFLFSQLEAITVLYSEIGTFGNHKHSYALKKLAREIFLECNLHNIPLSEVLYEFPEIETELIKRYKEYSVNLKKAINKIKKSKEKISAEYAYETLGVPYKIYKNIIDPAYQLPDLPNNFAYHRDSKKNIYENPIESYK